MIIQFTKGSALSPRPKDKPIIVAHIVNTAGMWGSGFVESVNQLSLSPKAAYKEWSKEGLLELGNVQFVEALPDMFIANIVGQVSPYDKRQIKVDYEAFKKGIKTVFHRALRLGAEVHMPALIGCVRAGGMKHVIYMIIREAAFEVENEQINSVLVASSLYGFLKVTIWEL